MFFVSKVSIEGPPKGSKKKSNAISQQPTIRPCPQPNLSSGIRITSRTPTPQTPVSTDSAKFNLIPAGLAFNSSLIKHETNDALNRTRTSSMDSLYADRSSVSSHQSSSNSATFNSQQVNGHYNHAGHNNNVNVIRDLCSAFTRDVLH